MLAVIFRALTSRAVAPVMLAACFGLLLLSVAQCATGAAETRRANRAEASLKTERANLQTCRANVGALEETTRRQNAAVAAAGEDSARRIKAAEESLTAALKGKADVERRVAALMKRPAGIDACARMNDADANVMRSLGR